MRIIEFFRYFLTIIPYKLYKIVYFIKLDSIKNYHNVHFYLSAFPNETYDQFHYVFRKYVPVHKAHQLHLVEDHQKHLRRFHIFLHFACVVSEILHNIVHGHCNWRKC